MDDSTLIIVLAIATLVLAGLVAVAFRARVARQKQEPPQSSFTQHHGEAPRPNRPGTDR